MLIVGSIVQLLTLVGAPAPGSGVGPHVDALHVVAAEVQGRGVGAALQAGVLEVGREVYLLLLAGRHLLLHAPHLHRLLLLELLLRHEGLLRLALLLQLLSLPAHIVALLYLK